MVALVVLSPLLVRRPLAFALIISANRLPIASLRPPSAKVVAFRLKVTARRLVPSPYAKGPTSRPVVVSALLLVFVSNTNTVKDISSTLCLTFRPPFVLPLKHTKSEVMVLHALVDTRRLRPVASLPIVMAMLGLDKGPQIPAWAAPLGPVLMLLGSLIRPCGPAEGSARRHSIAMHTVSTTLTVAAVARHKPPFSVLFPLLILLRRRHTRPFVLANEATADVRKS